MDTTKVGPGEMIAGISALALFVFMFLPWYGIDAVGGFGVGDLGGDLSAWEAFSFVDILLLIVTVIVLALVLALATDATPELPQPPALIVAAAGAVALLLVLFRLVFTPDLDTGGFDVDVDLGRKVGIFLGLIAAAGITYGGWRAMSESTATAGSTAPPPDRPAPPASPSAASTPPPPPAASTPPPTTPPSADPAPPAGGTPPEGQPPSSGGDRLP